MGVLEQAQVSDANWRKDVDRRLDESLERLDEHEERFEKGNKRFEEGEKRMTNLEALVKANNTMTETIQTNTADIVQWVKAITGFNSVMNWLLALLVKASVVIVAGGIVYWFVATGHLPKKAEAPREQQPAIFIEPQREPRTGRRRRSPLGLQRAGVARSMRVVLAEDFSLMVRTQPHRPLRARYGNPERLVLVN